MARDHCGPSDGIRVGYFFEQVACVGEVRASSIGIEEVVGEEDGGEEAAEF